MRIVMKNNIQQTVQKSWFKIDTPWKSVEMWLIEYIFPTPAAMKIFRKNFCTMWLMLAYRNWLKFALYSNAISGYKKIKEKGFYVKYV